MHPRSPASASAPLTCCAVFSAGLTVGAFTWGILVDIIGRRWAFNLTVGIVAVFGAYLRRDRRAMR